MGKIEQGILGAFSGKVGTVVGSSWRGVNYMRGKSTSRRHVTTVNQDMQRAKFELMASFIRRLSAMVNPGYEKLAIRMTSANAALSYNLKNGITGVYPNYEIDYSMILLSRGDLPNASSITIESLNSGVIDFNWVNNAGSGKALDTDMVLAIAYCPEKENSICSVLSEQSTRASLNLSLAVPEYKGLMVKTYLTFFSSNGKEVADSNFAGSITVFA